MNERLNRRDFIRYLLLSGAGLAFGFGCAEKKPEKSVDLEGIVIGEKYLSAEERRDVTSQYHFAVETTTFGVKSVNVEDVLVGNQWLKKEGIAAMIKPGDRVLLTSVQEQYLTYPTFSVAASNIQVLPKE